MATPWPRLTSLGALAVRRAIQFENTYPLEIPLMNRITAVALCMLAGCASTQDAASALATRFVGKNIDEFVLRYGAPFQRHELNSGDLMYTWSSGVTSYQMPGTTSVQGTRTSTGFVGTTTTTGGGTINTFCEVQIVTAPDGLVKSIHPVRDTLGNWALSRCAEVFGQ